MRTKKNMIRHEFIGLECRVAESSNSSCAGIKGKITDETMKTITIGKKKIMKKGSVFEIMVEKKKVNVNGNKICFRPEDRIKMKLPKW